jgi:uncharacterized membrane protein
VTPRDPLRHHRAVEHSPFGADRFGTLAERFARFFGTPQFLVGQTILVALWIGVNVAGVVLRWDPYPFILLNLLFSTQAAYAAPLILLAQTRQADRDKASSEAAARHREELIASQTALAEQSARLIGRLVELTEQIHAATCQSPDRSKALESPSHRREHGDDSAGSSDPESRQAGNVNP